MSLEDYIKQQEAKLQRGAQEVKHGAENVWDDTKAEARNITRETE